MINKYIFRHVIRYLKIIKKNFQDMKSYGSAQCAGVKDNYYDQEQTNKSSLIFFFLDFLEPYFY